MATDTPPSLTTSWLPVTTAWSAPSDCSSILWGSSASFLAINDPGYGISFDRDVSCLPPAATTWWGQNDPSIVYSIGPIVCPSAYSTASISLKDSSTFVACCPSGYRFNTIAEHGTAMQCQSWVTKGQEISLLAFTTRKGNEVGSFWYEEIATVTQAQVVGQGVHMNGWNFPATATPTSTTPTGNAPGSDNASNPSVVSKQSSGISTGAIAGIGVACGLAGLAAIVFAVLYFRAKKKRTSNGETLAELPEGAPPKDSYAMLPAYLPGDKEEDPFRAELQGPGDKEDNPFRAELQGRPGRHQDRAELG